MNQEKFEELLSEISGRMSSMDERMSSVESRLSSLEQGMAWMRGKLEGRGEFWADIKSRIALVIENSGTFTVTVRGQREI